MPRRPRQASASGYYHFINRGVNRSTLFYESEDFDFYKSLFSELTAAHGIRVLHYCFLSNHTHALIHAEDITSVSAFAHHLHRRYAYYLAKARARSEQVFKKGFIAKAVEDDAYLLECGRYIERNPLEAKLVTDPVAYPYSSYAFYAYARPDALVDKNPLYEDLGYDNRGREAAYRVYVNAVRIAPGAQLLPF